MTTFSTHTSGGGSKAQRLRRRWHDIEHDILLLSTSLALVPEPCTCEDGAAHLKGACACSVSRKGTPGVLGTDCDALLQSVERQMHALIADTLRVLPLGSRLTGNDDRSDDVRRQVEVVAGMVGRIRMAASDYRERCSAAHLSALKQRTQDLFRAGRRLNEMLERDVG